MSAGPSDVQELLRGTRLSRILLELARDPALELTVAEIQRLTGAAQAIVSREVEHLRRSGALSTRSLGRNRLFRLDMDQPWVRTLRRLVIETAGPIGDLGRELRKLHGVGSAWLVGEAAQALEDGSPLPQELEVVLISTGYTDDVELDEARQRMRRRGFDLEFVALPFSGDPADALGGGHTAQLFGKFSLGRRRSSRSSSRLEELEPAGMPRRSLEDIDATLDQLDRGSF